jgi:hypothetical protein
MPREKSELIPLQPLAFSIQPFAANALYAREPAAPRQYGCTCRGQGCPRSGRCDRTKGAGTFFKANCRKLNGIDVVQNGRLSFEECQLIVVSKRVSL